MKILFAGTPQFAVQPFLALYQAGYISAVLTQPDRPQGRKGVLTPPPVKVLAMERGIPVFQPNRLKEDYDCVKGFDAMITCAYGQILTQEILDLFPAGVWNIHASLLPAYRGAAPIQQAIIDGCTETGITIMKTDVGLDTGDILLQARVPIAPDDTFGTLSETLSALGAQMIVKAVQTIERGEAALFKQGEGFVCKKVQRTQVNFSQSADEVSALIRGLSPAPLSFGTVNGVLLNFYLAEALDCTVNEPFGTVLSASPQEGFVVACGKGAVRIVRLQPAGGKVMSARDFLNGRKVGKGMRFDKPVL